MKILMRFTAISIIYVCLCICVDGDLECMVYNADQLASSQLLCPQWLLYFYRWVEFAKLFDLYLFRILGSYVLLFMFLFICLLYYVYRPNDRSAVYGEGPGDIFERLYQSRREQAGTGQTVSHWQCFIFCRNTPWASECCLCYSHIDIQ